MRIFPLLAAAGASTPTPESRARGPGGPSLVPSSYVPTEREPRTDRQRYWAPPSQPGRSAKDSMLRLYPISRFRSTR